MKGSLSRSSLCRQYGLHEIAIQVSKSVVSSAGISAPTFSGLDFAFIDSITRVAEGEYKVKVKEVAARALVPKAIIPALGTVVAHLDSSDTESITVKTTTTAIIAARKASRIIQDLTYTADVAGVAGNGISLEYVEGSAKASLVVEDITYEAVDRGVAGNSIQIEYLDTVTAGNEVATVVGSTISVAIQAGVSTATQVKAAIDAETDATDLVTATITGTASDPQSDHVAAPLTGGGDIVISVVGDAITVGIETGQHDADAVKAAIEADVGAAALVDIVVSGTGATVQVIQAETFLENAHAAWAAGDVVDADYFLSFMWHQNPRLF